MAIYVLKQLKQLQHDCLCKILSVEQQWLIDFSIGGSELALLILVKLFNNFLNNK